MNVDIDLTHHATIRSFELKSVASIADILAYSDALERIGREDASFRVLKELHANHPSRDSAIRLMSAQCRLGIRDDALTLDLMSSYGDDPVFLAAQSEMDLIDGRLERGFASCGHRWSITKGERLLPMLKGSAWTGSYDPDLIVICEQGIGEEYLFSCTFNDIQHATIGCDPRLIGLFSRSFPQHRFIPKESIVTETKDYSSLVEAMDLFRFTGRRCNHEPWLKHNERHAAEIRGQFQSAFPGKLLVGVSWSSARATLSESKNIPASDLIALLGRQDCVFVSLQYGDVRGDLAAFREAGHIVYAMDNIEPTNDQDGLASLIMAMDCVVTCSNSVAHLAGALGQETHLIAPGRRFVLWYWGNDGDRTRWYPTIKIHRARQGWKHAIESVSKAIDNKRKVG